MVRMDGLSHLGYQPVDRHPDYPRVFRRADSTDDPDFSHACGALEESWKLDRSCI